MTTIEAFAETAPSDCRHLANSLTDLRGIAVTSADVAAVAAFDRFVASFVTHRADTPQRLQGIFEADPGLTMGHAALGVAAMLSARHALRPTAEAALEAARESLTSRGGTRREYRLVQALGLWLDGDWDGALRILDRQLRDAPHDLFVLKTVHQLAFMLGDRETMLRSAREAARRWTPEIAGFGIVQGCLAFAHEEAGEFDEAERLGRNAWERDRTDIWAAHAVGHVQEMRGRVALGLAWLDQTAAGLEGCGNFTAHVHWHRALFMIEAGRLDQAVALYDEVLVPTMTEDYRDFANAVSLLWRLARRGVEVASRMAALADWAEQRIEAYDLVFAELHLLLALAEMGRDRSVLLLLDTMRRRSSAGSDSQSAVSRVAGLDLALGLAALADGRAEDAARFLVPSSRHFQAIGGSHAQRDVFIEAAGRAAHACGRSGLVDKVVRRRSRWHAASDWTRRIESEEGVS